MSSDADILPDDIDALRAALAGERAARQSAEARATGAEAMITHLELQADAYAGFNELYLPGRLPGAITEAAC